MEISLSFRILSLCWPRKYVIFTIYTLPDTFPPDRTQTAYCWQWMWAISLVSRTDMYHEKFLPHEIFMCFFFRKLLCLKASGVSSVQVNRYFQNFNGFRYFLKAYCCFLKQLVNLDYLYCIKTSGFALCVVNYTPWEKQHKLVSLKNFTVTKAT